MASGFSPERISSGCCKVIGMWDISWLCGTVPCISGCPPCESHQWPPITEWPPKWPHRLPKCPQGGSDAIRNHGRAWETRARIWDFVLCAMGSQWTVLSREAKWSDFGFQGIFWPWMERKPQRCWAGLSLPALRVCGSAQSYPKQALEGSGNIAAELCSPLCPTTLQAQVFATTSSRVQQCHSPTHTHPLIHFYPPSHSK